MTSKKTVSDLIENYVPGYSLDQAFYKDPETYKREIDEIFLKRWILAGHVSKIPNIGDFFLVEFDQESVIITRAKSGQVKALLNVCRHRGSHVCKEKQGNAKAFTCPYHAWSYDLEGKLIAARMMDDDFDKSDNSLHQASVELVGGLIFISLSDNPPSLSAMKDDLNDVFEQFGFDHMKLAEQKSYVIPANWKLALENYQECYHCAPSHKEFSQIHALAQHPEKFAVMKQAYDAQKNHEIRIKAAPFFFDMELEGQEGYEYSRYPLLPGSKSGTLGGKPAAPFLGNITKYDGASSEFMVGPVTFFLIYNDHMVAYRFLPISIDECVCDIFWFVHEDAVQGDDYDLKNLTWLWDVTTQADKEIIVNNQKGVNSHFYKPGKLAGMESQLQHFLSWYLKTIR